MSLTFGVPDAVLSTTLANYRQTMTENIFRANPLFWYLVGKNPAVAGETVATRGQMMIKDGGTQIAIPLLYEKNSTAKAYSKYGLLDTTPQESITAASFNWKQYGVSISISGLEQRQNNGKSQIINLLGAKTSQAEMSLKELLGADAFGLGTDSTATLNGLQNLVSNTTTTGGLSGTSYPWWQSKVNAATVSMAAGGMDAMRTMYNNVTRGLDKCDLIITDQTNFERYEKLLQPQERFNDTDMADGGFTSLKFKGAPMTYDLYAPAGQMFFLNSNYLNLVIHSEANFSTTDFVRPANQDAKIAQILFMGELTVSNRSRQGVISILTA